MAGHPRFKNLDVFSQSGSAIAHFHLGHTDSTPSSMPSTPRHTPKSAAQLMTPPNVLGWSSDESEAYGKALNPYDISFNIARPPQQAYRSIRTSSPPMASSSSVRSLVTERAYSHPSITSERRAQRNRERDPAWVPRPRNAFIIFRCQYSQNHARENKDNEPTAEKTLSKRAAEAWRTLTEHEKQPWKDAAEQERKSHAKNHPGYKYRPRKRNQDAHRKIGSLSRREQVESFVDRVTSRSSSVFESDSASDYTNSSSPTSMDSSPSPEPPSTPFRTGSPSESVQYEGRSSSMPAPYDVPLHDRLQQSLFLSSALCASSPNLVSHSGTVPESDVGFASIPSPYGEQDAFGWPESYSITDVSSDSSSSPESPSWTPIVDTRLDLFAFESAGVTVSRLGPVTPYFEA